MSNGTSLPYSIDLYDESYISETERSLEARFFEHIRPTTS